MNLHSILRPEVVIAALLILLPMLIAAIFPVAVNSLEQKLPRALFLLSPSLLCVPYVLVAQSFGMLRWNWLVLYAMLPVAIAIVLSQARKVDPGQKGNWRDFLVLGVLGLAVDLRWFEPAWPTGLSALGKMLLLDAGIFAFLAVRQLDGVGFDLRLKWRDAGIGLREFFLYAPIAIFLGLSMGFLHLHASLPAPLPALGAYLFTFFFIAIPERGSSFAGGSRIFWSGESAAPRRWRPRPSSSGWRIGTNGLPASTGNMFCSPLWREFSMEGRGAPGAVWQRQPSPTLRLTLSGRSGSGEAGAALDT